MTVFYYGKRLSANRFIIPNCIPRFYRSRHDIYYFLFHLDVYCISFLKSPAAVFAQQALQTTSPFPCHQLIAMLDNEGAQIVRSGSQYRQNPRLRGADLSLV